jgi:hypothetical protein
MGCSTTDLKAPTATSNTYPSGTKCTLLPTSAVRTFARAGNNGRYLTRGGTLRVVGLPRASQRLEGAMARVRALGQTPQGAAGPNFKRATVECVCDPSDLASLLRGCCRSSWAEHEARCIPPARLCRSAVLSRARLGYSFAGIASACGSHRTLSRCGGVRTVRGRMRLTPPPPACSPVRVRFASALNSCRYRRLAKQEHPLDVPALCTVMQRIVEQPALKLTTLALVDCALGTVGLRRLAQFLPHSRLTHLDLKRNGIDAEGARAMAAVLTDTAASALHLEHLDLGYNAVGDTGACVRPGGRVYVPLAFVCGVLAVLVTLRVVLVLLLVALLLRVLRLLWFRWLVPIIVS